MEANLLQEGEKVKVKLSGDGARNEQSKQLHLAKPFDSPE